MADSDRERAQGVGRFDDNAEFVNGAIAAGVQGIIFSTLPELVDTLSALGLSGDRPK